MAEHTLLLSGYGAPGCDDLAVCRLESDGTLRTLFTARHGRAPSFCCQGENGWIYVASERQDGADITAYALEDGGFREIASLEIPGGQALCHLYPLGNVIYGSCFGNGLFFAVSGDLSRILWKFQPRGANAHWAQAVGRTLFLADLGNHCLYRFPLQNHLPVGDAVVLPQPVGSGPRQVLDTGGNTITCVYELDGSLRALDGDGKILSAVQASRDIDHQNWPGGACIAENGVLLVCNRGPNTISAWKADGKQYSALQEWPTGDWPRHLCAVPGTAVQVTGDDCLIIAARHLCAVPGTAVLLAACQREGAVHCYDVSGLPQPPRETARIDLPGASCVLVLKPNSD